MVAGTVREAEHHLSAVSQWAAFILDIRLPDGSGLDLLLRIRPSHAETPALIITGHLEREFVQPIFDAGAKHLLKPCDWARLARFIEDASPFSSRLAQRVEAWRLTYRISASETDVLHRYARGESREAIAQARGCSLETIKRHVANLLRQTGDASLHAAVERILRECAGLSFVNSPDDVHTGL